MALRESFFDFNVKDENMDRLQSNLKRYFRQFNDLPFLDGVPLDATVGTVNTPIAHKLGREPQGWIVFDKLADARVWRISWTDKFITLRASASVNIKMWVY